MRWGASSAKPSALTWVRPLHAIVATFGPETEEPDVVEFAVDGVAAGNTTYGHRFMAPSPIAVRRFDDYASKLERAKVVLDPQRRAEMILTDAKNLAFAQGFELIEDEALLAEVTGLVEWPVVLMGTFDPAFLSIPPEVIRSTIRNNQKCFVLRDPQTAKLVNKFILVSNMEASDGGKAIVAGNERVIRARLSDAKFFYETDLKTRLEDRLPKFKQIVFHEKLGTQSERIERIESLAAKLAPVVGADLGKVRRAARLAKADLLTEVVGEFPELQGLMGKYYAEAQGEDEVVAHACEDHYKPQGQMISCLPCRCLLRWRWRTNSTCSSAFGASKRNQPAARTRTREASRARRHSHHSGQQNSAPVAVTLLGRTSTNATLPSNLWGSSRTGSKCSCASRARVTTSSTRCSRSRIRMIWFWSLRGSKRSRHCLKPRTARTCWPAISAPPTSCASRRSATGRYDGPPDETLYILPEEVALRSPSPMRRKKRPAPSRRKILLPPCVPWPVCDRMLMRSSTR